MAQPKPSVICAQLRCSYSGVNTAMTTLLSVRHFHSTAFHPSASPFASRLSLTNLDTSHRLLPSRFRRSRQRSLNPRARMCRSSSVEVRRPASSAYLIVWVGRGCRWRDRGIVLRNPLSGGMRHLYWPAVRTDGGATGVWRGVSRRRGLCRALFTRHGVHTINS